MNIYLIGMMGSGKSTVGNLVAQKMRLQFIDLDIEIENFVGKPIKEIFKKNSEEFFRKIESKCLKRQSKSIIACGGGIILEDKNISYINKHGKTVLLTALSKTTSSELELVSLLILISLFNFQSF